MAQAINFAVRDAAGGIVRGTVGGDGGNFIPVGTGESISLNLSSASVVSYERNGKDLVIKLADGSEVTLNGYFNDMGAENRLYLSSDGVISEVMLNPAYSPNAPFLRRFALLRGLSRRFSVRPSTATGFWTGGSVNLTSAVG